ncbi:hypothetical protein [Microbacterium sp.]|uniref:hypothetical protein n=1 Tax=Microbacterium sp. TaxID=51671 RepID=UPI003A870BB2
MAESAPNADTAWTLLPTPEVATLLAGTDVRWWLSAESAYDQWHGSPLQERENATVSTIAASVEQLITDLPDGLSAWIVDDSTVTAWADAPDASVPSVRVYDPERAAWVLQINIEDGTADRWVYRRDPRLQLPWDRAVTEIDGIPTGAPEVQLVWKTLRPKPEDEVDKDAVLPKLSEEARAFWETAVLRIHPHSTWAIHVRTPLTPAKASWNRTRR